MVEIDENVIKSFMELGLSEQKAKETYKNATVTKNLLEILKEVQKQTKIYKGILFNDISNF